VGMAEEPGPVAQETPTKDWTGVACGFPTRFTSNHPGRQLTAPGVIGDAASLNLRGTVEGATVAGANVGEGQYVYVEMDGAPSLEVAERWYGSRGDHDDRHLHAGRADDIPDPGRRHLHGNSRLPQAPGRSARPTVSPTTSTMPDPHPEWHAQRRRGVSVCRRLVGVGAQARARRYRALDLAPNLVGCPPRTHHHGAIQLDGEWCSVA
jgi:hypothetical protein